ncbi:MAG: hypothetical protein WCI51_01260, partial [Lentisphaerota bacterium]
DGYAPSCPGLRIAVFGLMIAEQPLESGDPALLGILDKVQVAGRDTNAGRKTKAAQGCRSPKSGRSG